MKPKDRPLRVSVRGGVLTIEIGVACLAFAAIHSEYGYELLGYPERTGRPDERFEIRNAQGFAGDVKRALLDEAEDGSSLLTKLLDDASRNAIEEGSEWFLDKEDESR